MPPVSHRASETGRLLYTVYFRIITFSNQVDGPEPLYISLRTTNQIQKYIIQVISTLTKKDKVPNEYINIVVDDNLYDNLVFDENELLVKNDVPTKDCNYIGIFKTSEYKGMESNVIFYVHSKNTEYSYKYVGLTRARFFLYDIELDEQNN